MTPTPAATTTETETEPLTLVGVLDVEPVNGVRRTQPAGVVLRNDGDWGAWLDPDHTYELRHDGIGWRVTSPLFAEWGDHILYLARDGFPTGRLPLVRGRVFELKVTSDYHLRCSADVWALYER